MHKLFFIFSKSNFNQHLVSIFRMCSFDSETFQDDIFNLDIKFRRFSKSCKSGFCSIFPYYRRRFHFFFPDRQIWSNHCWNFVEWIQEIFLHTYHDIMFRSNFRIREKKKMKIHFLCYFP